MSEPKLKAKLFVHAAIRRCGVHAIAATVARKGDEDSGTILVRVYRSRDACDLYSQVRDGAGRLGWMKVNPDQPMTEERTETYIARAKDVDWDLWVLDVESPSGEVPFIEEVVAGGGKLG